MSHYSALRFKGIVKSGFRQYFDLVATQGEWESTTDTSLTNFFKENDRAKRIPMGNVDGFPDEWEDINGKPTEGFDLQWNRNTGYWAFQCSLNYGHDLIMNFFNLLPHFIEKINYLELKDEDSFMSMQYALRGDKVELVDKNFKAYF